MRCLLLLSLFRLVLGSVEEELSSTSPDNNLTFTTNEILSTFYELSTESCNNSECINVTEAPVPTSTKRISKNLSIPTTSKIPKNVHHRVTSKQDTVCLCDLHRDVCDINCCCDADCTYEKKRIFDHCNEFRDVNIDKRQCNYLHLDYVNFTIHEWDVQNNDFFCVVKSNIPASYTIQKKDSFATYSESILEKDMRYNWPEKLENTEQKKKYSESYVQGMPIFIILDNTTINTFKLNEAFISSGCNILSEIQYLNNIDNECVQVLKSENKNIDAEYYSNLLFITRPQIFNNTKLKNKFMACPKTTCSRANLKICSDKDLLNCSNKSSTFNLSLECSETNKTVQCRNVVASIKYHIYHNGILGIDHVDLSLHMINVTFEHQQKFEFDQKLSVVFDWLDAPINHSNTLSGNPGYLAGRPILMATEIEEGKMARNPKFYKENFMVLPHEEAGICEYGKDSYQPIEFAYNTILQCKIRDKITIFKNMKALEVCKKIQVDVFKYWNIFQNRGYFVNRTYGSFGNANISNLDDWGKFLYEKSPKEVLDNITGHYTNRNNSVSCARLVFGLTIDIYHARVDLQKLLNQEKILAVTHQFERTSINEQFHFDILNFEISYEFDLDTKVSFIDVTPKKTKKLLDPPSLNIKLPSDFFYPFVKVGNIAGRNYDIICMFYFVVLGLFLNIYL